MSISEEFATRNFSIYGQCRKFYRSLNTDKFLKDWCFMYLSLFRPWDISSLPREYHDTIRSSLLVCQVNPFRFIPTKSSRASSFVIIFVEIPLLMKICPTSSRFDEFMRQFSTNYMRAAIYLSMGLIQWLSLIGEPSSLLAAAILLTLAGAFYTLAGIKGQGFVGSKTLGGQGVAQMII
ncbi:hypothetical protein Golomagni_00601 [Golovinomyces magnicellulatus]|nr:hypothetical protein Golomagni_00601 [Golovinomyces magnicellulatus]